MNDLYVDKKNRILDPTRRDLEPQVGDRTFIPGTIRQVDEQNRRVTAVVSTSDLDRFSEIIEPEAFRKRLDAFKKNPVMLASHKHDTATGRPAVIGSWVQLEVTGDGLRGTCEFAEGTEAAEEHWRLYRDRHMRAFSVGFLVHEWQMREFEDPKTGKTYRARVFTDVELMEISAVAVPANREAVARHLGQHLGGTHQRGVRLGERVEARRNELELTQQEVAADLPITASTYGGIERGEIIRPPDNVLEAIAEVLDLDFEELQRLADQDQQDQGESEESALDDEAVREIGGGDGDGDGDGKALSTRRIKKEAVRALRPVVRQEIRRALDTTNDTSELQRVIDITAEATAQQFMQFLSHPGGHSSRAGGAPSEFDPVRDAGEDFDEAELLDDELDDDVWEDEDEAGRSALERIRESV